MKTIISLLFLVFISLVSFESAFGSSATFYYSDGPWSGKIIDAETKEPIEGAVVVAVWQKSYATPAGNDTNYFDVVEAVTDKKGNFILPKYKALNITPIISFIEGPDFTIFKRGYATFPGFGAQYFKKYFPEKLNVDRKTLAELFKKVVVLEMPKLKTWIERIESHELAYFYGYDHAPDSKIPHFKQLLKEEDEFLKPMYKYNREKLNIPVGEIPK